MSFPDVQMTDLTKKSWILWHFGEKVRYYAAGKNIEFLFHDDMGYFSLFYINTFKSLIFKEYQIYTFKYCK